MVVVPEALEWIGSGPQGHLRLLDQTRLPQACVDLDCRDVQTLFEAIRRLSVRGAPAIGIAAAYGCVLGAQEGALAAAMERLAQSRPTAVNLFWALERMRAVGSEDPATLLAEAQAIHAEDQAMCQAIGQAGIGLIGPDTGVLTHCNAGALATGGIGTATAPMYLAHEAGVGFRVYVDETRPLLQGARLTSWELANAGLDVHLLCDGAAAALMGQGKVDLVITGADRIAANGDTANKIGTRALAILAAHHEIPFYIAAPISTLDRQCPDGASIPIEQRRGEEVTTPFGQPWAPSGLKVENPAFDVTPAHLIHGFLTDQGLVTVEQLGQWS